MPCKTVAVKLIFATVNACYSFVNYGIHIHIHYPSSIIHYLLSIIHYRCPLSSTHPLYIVYYPHALSTSIIYIHYPSSIIHIHHPLYIIHNRYHYHYSLYIIHYPLSIIHCTLSNAQQPYPLFIIHYQLKHYNYYHPYWVSFPMIILYIMWIQFNLLGICTTLL